MPTYFPLHHNIPLSPLPLPPPSITTPSTYPILSIFSFGVCCLACSLRENRRIVKQVEKCIFQNTFGLKMSYTIAKVMKLKISTPAVESSIN